LPLPKPKLQSFAASVCRGSREPRLLPNHPEEPTSPPPRFVLLPSFGLRFAKPQVLKLKPPLHPPGLPPNPKLPSTTRRRRRPCRPRCFPMLCPTPILPCRLTSR
jgi:hypothetical protein